jgi:outer membrane immunogenic protein
MKKSVLAAAAAFAIASGAMTIQASAADLQFEPPPPPFQPTWAGFYIGGHVGYGEASVDANARVEGDFGAGPEVQTFSTSLDPSGLIGGVQAGYNWQAGSLVFGLEGDISFTDWEDSAVIIDTNAGDLGGPFPERHVGSVSAEVDFLATIRGRLGYAFDSLLVYGTGGVAFVDATAKGRGQVDGVTTTSESESFNDIGFVAGAGVAWMVIPQTFSVGVEGLYYFLDEKTTLVNDTVDGVNVRATAELDDAWVLRARADFHF